MHHAVHDSDRTDLSPPPRALAIMAWAALGTLLSVLMTGFVFGAGNNMFHLPIVAALFDEPQYRDDVFIQSLRYYASGFWLVLRGAGTSIDPYWLFFGLHVVSRFVAFLGFLACAGLLGIRSRIDVIIFTLLLSICSLSQGLSYAGSGGLFINIFTHSELATGLTLFALYFIARGKVAASFAMNGVIFFINAFVAFWNAFPFALVIADRLRRRELRLSRVVLESAIGLAIFAVCAIPVMRNIFANTDFGRPLGFDYVEFLGSYFPDHFLIWGNRPQELFTAALVVAIGFLSFRILGNAARRFQLILAGYVLVFLVGTVVPLLTHHPLVLNLHFLRVSTFFHLLAALGVVVVITKWLQSADPVRARLLAPALIVLTCTVRNGAVLAPFVLLAHFDTGAQTKFATMVNRLKYLRAALLSVAVLALAYAVSSTWRENHVQTTWMSEWTRLGEWARASTPLTAVFLVPNVDLIANNRRYSPLAEAADIGPSTFEFASHRRVWGDFRRGGIVMWTPSYYGVWRQRVDEQVGLRTLDERIDYARRHGVTHVIDLCAADSEARAVQRTARLCVFAVP